MAHVRDRPPAPTSLRPELPAAVDVVFAPGDGQGPRGALPDLFGLRRRPARRARRRSGRALGRSEPSRRRRTPLVVAAVLGLGLVAVAGLALASGLLGGAGSGAVTVGIGSAGAVAPTDGTHADQLADAGPVDLPERRPSRRCSPSSLRTWPPPAFAAAARPTPTAAGWNGQIVDLEIRRRAEHREQLRAGPARRPEGVARLHARRWPGPGLCSGASTADLDSSDVGGRGVAFSVAHSRRATRSRRGSCTRRMPRPRRRGRSAAVPSRAATSCASRTAAWDDGVLDLLVLRTGNTLGFATRKDADYDALYDWWQNLTLFIE